MDRVVFCYELMTFEEPGVVRKAICTFSTFFSPSSRHWLWTLSSLKCVSTGRCLIRTAQRMSSLGEKTRSGRPLAALFHLTLEGENGNVDLTGGA
jgi:hypothetical protein